MSKTRPAVLLSALLIGAASFSAPVFAGHYGHYGNQGQQHHGYAAPADNRPKHAALGVKISELPQAELERMGLEYGVAIQAVKPGSVAANAGLQAGDVVTSISERPVYSIWRLQYLVKKSQGTTPIVVLRNAEELQLQAAFVMPGSGRAMLGVHVQPMTEDLKQAFGTDGQSGVLVSRVIEGSAAGTAGIAAGDVIVSLGGDSISSVKQLYRLVGEKAPGDRVDLTFVRDREQQVVPVELGEVPNSRHASKAHAPGMHGHHKYWHKGGKHPYGCRSPRSMYRS